MLATAVGLKIFGGNTDGRERRSQVLIGADTDNQGNPYATAKMLSTKFPLNIVIMQMATLMEQAGIYLNLKWIPREDNVLADALTNEDFSAFSPARRMHVQLNAEALPTMFNLLSEGKKLYEHVEAAKVANKGTPRVWPKTPNAKRLKFTDPW